MHLRKRWVVFILLVLFHQGFVQTNISPRQYFFLIRELFPNKTHIGILIQQDFVNETWIEKIKRAAAALKLHACIAQVKEIKDVAPQLKQLIEEYGIEVLWVYGEGELLNQKMVRSYIIQHVAMFHLPVFVPRGKWVQEGGGFFIERRDGRIRLQVNRRIAELLHVQIPERYLSKTVFVVHK